MNDNENNQRDTDSLYDIVTTDFRSDMKESKKSEKDIFNLRGNVEKQIKKTTKDALKDESGLAMIYSGAKNLNYKLVKTGVKKIARLKINVGELVEANYKNFIRYKEDIKENLEEIKSEISNQYSYMKTNIEERDRDLERKNQLEADTNNIISTVEKLNAERQMYLRDPSSMPNYNDAKSDMELLEAKREKMAKFTELTSIVARIEAKRQTNDILGVTIQENEARLPEIERMYVAAEEKINQLDIIIESNSKSLNSLEMVFNLAKSYKDTKNMLEESSKIMSIMNANLHQVTKYIIETPPIDAALLSERLESIKKLKNDTENAHNLLLGQPEFYNLGIKDCYDILGLPMTASINEIGAAREKLSKEYNKDSDKTNYRKIEYAAKEITNFVGLADGKRLLTK